MTAQPLLQFAHVRKQFSGLFALCDIDFQVFENDHVALVGENGAGKSTLMKILCGIWPAGSYEGNVTFDGRSLCLQSPVDARRLGISIIHQELCLFRNLSVAENLFLTESFPYNGTPSSSLLARVRWQELNRRAQDLLDELGFPLCATALIDELSVAKRQLVEIARAFHQRARVLVLDEPTSALSSSEVEALFAVIERMRGKMTLIYISHKLEEVFRLCNRVIVLRDGASVGEWPATESNRAAIIRDMVGRDVAPQLPRVCTNQGPPVLEVRRLDHTSSAGKPVLRGIQFTVHCGEIVCVTGLMGAGRSELLRSLLGILAGSRQGQVTFCGREVAWSGMIDSMESGVGYVPEDRKKEGLFLDRSVGFNFSISVLDRFSNRWGALDLKEELRKCGEWGQRFKVKYPSLESPVRFLSGGNQQKVLLGKVVAQQPKLILLDEPTRGIDVGAKQEIYQLVKGLARGGVAFLIVSSEMPEVLALSDRVIVLREGLMAAALDAKGLTQETILKYAAIDSGKRPEVAWN